MECLAQTAMEEQLFTALQSTDADSDTSFSQRDLTHCCCISSFQTLQEGRPEQRNANDVSFNNSAALAAKVAKKAEMKKQQEEEAARNASNQPVVRKKVVKKKEADNLDDLLSAGLGGTGKKK
eukprot:scaffold3003_cov148-Alexandrium_tamarense.AAC.3